MREHLAYLPRASTWQAHRMEAMASRVFLSGWRFGWTYRSSPNYPRYDRPLRPRWSARR